MDVDVAKKTRKKRSTWEPGDCVSVPPIRFGPAYSSMVPGDITKIYGRVKEVLTHRLLVKWDLDKNESFIDTDKVTKESRETKSQYINVDAVVTADDYEEAGTTSSRSTTESWKMIDDDNPTDDNQDNSDTDNSDAIQFFINKQRNKRKRKKEEDNRKKAKKIRIEKKKLVSSVACDVSLIPIFSVVVLLF